MTKEPWTIWTAKVIFEDHPFEFKYRPIVFINETDCFCLSLKVTSKLHHSNSYILKDWKEEGLTKESAVRLDAFLKIPPSDVTSYVGKLSEYDRRQLETEVKIRIAKGQLSFE